MFSVDDFLYYATDLSGCRVQIFNLIKGEIVWDSKMHPDDDIISEISFQGFGSYEVVSYDIYVDRSDKPCLDINIEIDEEDE